MSFEENCSNRRIFNRFYCQKNELVPTYSGVKVSRNVFLIDQDAISTQLDGNKLKELLKTEPIDKQNLNPLSFYDEPTFCDSRSYHNDGFLDFPVYFIGIDSFVILVICFENHGFCEESERLTFETSFFALAINTDDFRSALMRLKLIFG